MQTPSCRLLAGAGQGAVNGPDFIGIGAARCATTWTSACLGAHPGIFMARGDGKTYFFNRYYDQGMGVYERFFDGAPAGAVRGELTETYLFDDAVPARIARHLPDVKIFVIFRNPVDRAYSTYLHLVRDGMLKPGRFEAEIRLKEKVFIRDNLYADRFGPYLDHFPEKNIHVMLYEDIRQNPTASLKSLYAFLGADPDVIPRAADERINPAVEPRIPWLNKIMTLTSWVMRDLGLVGLRYRIRSSSLMKSLRFRAAASSAPPPMPPDARRQLQDVFQEPNQRFSRLIKRDLSAWQ